MSTPFVRVITLVSVLAFSTASADVMEVSARLIPGGIELDGGSGPKQFLCQKDKMVGKLVSGGKTYNMVGKYLSIDFGEHLGFEAYDKERPRLTSNEVRLTCIKGEIKVKVGSEIEILDEESED